MKYFFARRKWAFYIKVNGVYVTYVDRLTLNEARRMNRINIITQSPAAYRMEKGRQKMTKEEYYG